MLRIKDKGVLDILISKGRIPKGQIEIARTAIKRIQQFAQLNYSILPPANPADILYRALVTEFGRFHNEGEACWELTNVIKGRKFRLDCALPNFRIGVELDGFQYHSQLQSFQRDREKWVAYVRQGWLIIPVSNKQVRDNLDFIIESVTLAILNTSRGKAICEYTKNGFTKFLDWNAE